MPLSFGDDASALDIRSNQAAVINVDVLVGKTDAPKDMTVWQAARKSVIRNISDSAAKEAKPLVLLASIGVPLSLNETEIKQIGKWLNAGALEYNTYMLGGDTNEAPDLIISSTALGICNRHDLIKRTGRKPGDCLAVTGSLGKQLPDSKSWQRIFLLKSRQALADSVLMPKQE
jgi:thiamine-monophosphate kinase